MSQLGLDTPLNPNGLGKCFIRIEYVMSRCIGLSHYITWLVLVSVLSAVKIQMRTHRNQGLSR